MSFLARMIPQGGGPKSPSLQQAIDKICNSLFHSSMLEDRRAAAQSLRSLSLQHSVEVGSSALSTILNSLKRDFEDIELLRHHVETLLTLCSPPGNEFHVEFSEIVLKEQEVIEIILNSLNEEQQHLRFAILQLLHSLHESQPRKTAAAIVSSPTGLTNLIDGLLLNDSREVIRSEVLLLLQNLTKDDPEIQKLSTFNNAMEAVFDVVERQIDGGIFSGDVIVEEGFKLVHNLLRFNPSNQNYFRESSCFPSLKRLLSTNTPDLEWTEQATLNFASLLQLIQIILDEENPKLPLVQGSLFKIGVFPLLLNYSMNSSLLAKEMSMLLLGDLVYLNSPIQQALSSQVYNDIITKEPTPYVLLFIQESLDGETDGLRRAATRLIGRYLLNNSDGQLAIASTFRSPANGGTSAGSSIVERLVDRGRLRKDVLSVHFPAMILGHVLRGNKETKKMAMEYCRVEDNLFSDILTGLFETAHNESLMETTTSYLQILITWIDDFPLAAETFLMEGSNVQFLLEMINQNSTVHPIIQGCSAFLFGIITLTCLPNVNASFSKMGLVELIRNRVAVDVFSSRISRLSKILFESKDSDFVIFDEEFLNLFKRKCDKFLLILGSQSIPKQFTTIKSISIGVGTEDESTTNVTRFEMESLRMQITELQEKCKLQTYLEKENARLKSLADAYLAQVMELEREYEETMIILASENNNNKEKVTIAESIAYKQSIAEEDKLKSMFSGNTSDVSINREFELPLTSIPEFNDLPQGELHVLTARFGDIGDTMTEDGKATAMRFTEDSVSNKLHAITNDNSVKSLESATVSSNHFAHATDV